MDNNIVKEYIDTMTEIKKCAARIAEYAENFGDANIEEINLNHVDYAKNILEKLHEVMDFIIMNDSEQEE